MNLRIWNWNLISRNQKWSIDYFVSGKNALTFSICSWIKDAIILEPLERFIYPGTGRKLDQLQESDSWFGSFKLKYFIGSKC